VLAEGRSGWRRGRRSGPGHGGFDTGDITRIRRFGVDALGQRFRVLRRVRGGRRTVLSGVVGFDYYQRRADGDAVAFRARDLDHGARHRAFHLDRRLVGHHVGERSILLDPVADFTCQATISASAMPSPMSGRRNV
jgi:hypothetical protein